MFSVAMRGVVAVCACMRIRRQTNDVQGVRAVLGSGQATGEHGAHLIASGEDDVCSPIAIHIRAANRSRGDSRDIRYLGAKGVSTIVKNAYGSDALVRDDEVEPSIVVDVDWGERHGPSEEAPQQTPSTQ